jgi:hypothetical protein
MMSNPGSCELLTPYANKAEGIVQNTSLDPALNVTDKLLLELDKTASLVRVVEFVSV